MSRGYRVAVVGATGVVGTTMRAMLRERQFPGARSWPSPPSAPRGASSKMGSSCRR